MSRTSLTERYVWTVTRQLPPETGPDVGRELRGAIEESVEARVAAGEDPEAAERETILGLGDPDVLAREYGGRDEVVDTWSPEELADPAERARRVSVTEMIAEVVLTVVLIALVVWQLRGVGEGSVQVLDPGLGLGWGALIVGPLALDVLVTVAAWARGGWSLPLAAAGLVSAVVSGVVLVWLLLAGRLLTDLPQELDATFGWGTGWSVPVPAVAVGIALVCGWEAVTALRRMRDARRRTLS